VGQLTCTFTHFSRVGSFILALPQLAVISKVKYYTTMSSRHPKGFEVRERRMYKCVLELLEPLAGEHTHHLLY